MQSMTMRLPTGKKILTLLSAALTVAIGAPEKSLAQQGPTSTSCTAYMNGNAVGNYNCLVGIDQNDNVNFIQWEDGTASTGLGGWKRSSRNCFTASESQGWKICKD